LEVKLEIGKLTNDLLKELILGKLKNKRPEVLLRPGIGEDCCAIGFGDEICVLSSDPITGAVNEVGKLAVHISCNDIASCGVEPLGLLTTILAPPGTTEKDLDRVMSQLCETAGALNVDIIGGHTEITDSVNRFVIISTAIGKILRDKLVSTSGARCGDDMIMTKSAGIEGTAIIAHDREEELEKYLSRDIINSAKGFINRISVVKEGVIAGEFGANSMHDATEGGILGAVWEVCEASGTGVELYAGKIPIALETSEICGIFGINPLRLISSGCMIITCSNGEALVQRLRDNGIDAAVIGRIMADGIFVYENGTEKPLEPPEADELFSL
jgi:hydrogenase maturation factor